MDSIDRLRVCDYTSTNKEITRKSYRHTHSRLLQLSNKEIASIPAVPRPYSHRSERKHLHNETLLPLKQQLIGKPELEETVEVWRKNKQDFVVSGLKYCFSDRGKEENNLFIEE